MSIQEIIVFGLVLAAGVFTVRQFVRQFTQGESGEGGCSSCDLNKGSGQKKMNPAVRKRLLSRR